MPAVLTEERILETCEHEVSSRPRRVSSVDLELKEVKGYMSKHNEQTGMERFSIYFRDRLNLRCRRSFTRFSTPRWVHLKCFSCPSRKTRRAFAMNQCSTILRRVNDQFAKTLPIIRLILHVGCMRIIQLDSN